LVATTDDELDSAEEGCVAFTDAVDELLDPDELLVDVDEEIEGIQIQRHKLIVYLAVSEQAVSNVVCIAENVLPVNKRQCLEVETVYWGQFATFYPVVEERRVCRVAVVVACRWSDEAYTIRIVLTRSHVILNSMAEIPNDVGIYEGTKFTR